MNLPSEPRRLRGPRPYSPPRPAEADDVDAISRLSAPFVNSGALRYRDPASLRTRLNDFRIIVHDQTLIGCVGLQQLPAASPGLVLFNFCVHPQFHGRGIGTSLLAEALRLAQRREVHQIFTASNQAGTWFTRNGFTILDFERSPHAWRRELDPRRKSTLYVRTVNETS